MRIAFGLLVFLAACGSDTEMFPVGGGGTDGGFPDGHGTVDAQHSDAPGTGGDGAVAPVDANVFQGRVCLLTDPRKLHTCDDTNAGGLTVRLGTASTTTAADGTFFIVGQSGNDLVWRITGPNIKSSYEVLRDYQIPAITKTMYSDLLNANGVMEVAGEGALMVEITHNGAGQSGAGAASNPPGFYSAFYEGSTATMWSQGGTTGANGSVWIPGIDVGSTTLTVVVPQAVGSPLSLTSTHPIFDDGVTFADVLVP